MMIQRLQSVWLLIAAILVSVFCFVPMAIVPSDMDPGSATFLAPKDMPVFLVVNILVALLLFMAIFLYKNTKRQKTVTLVSMVLLAVLMATESFVLFGWHSQGDSVEWLGSIFLLVGALIFALLAYRGISHDEKLLKSADRLR